MAMASSNRWFSGLGLPLVAALATGACGGAQQPETTVAEVKPPRIRYGNLSSSAYRAETFDLNNDGRADQTRYTDGSGRVAWVARDIDFDGRVDFFEHYDASGAVVEQELQLDFDDAIDLVRVFDQGRLVRKEFMTGFSSTASMFKYYDSAGNVLRVERDTDDDGRVDFFGYYEGGQLTRVGIDLDRDGRPDDIESYD